MGRKRIFKRNKNIFCSTFSLILILLAGCQYSYYPKLSIATLEGNEGRGYLHNARVYAEQGNFKAAFEENELAYEFFPPGMKQEAIFQKGLLYAHPANPNRNYEKAVACFELIGENADNTVLETNAPFILAILQDSSRLKKKDSANYQNLKHNKKKLMQFMKEKEALAKELKKQKRYNAKLRKQIKQLKEVDLNAAEKSKGL